MSNLSRRSVSFSSECLHNQDAKKANVATDREDVDANNNATNAIRTTKILSFFGCLHFTSFTNYNFPPSLNLPRTLPLKNMIRKRKIRKCENRKKGNIAARGVGGRGCVTPIGGQWEGEGGGIPIG